MARKRRRIKNWTIFLFFCVCIPVPALTWRLFSVTEAQQTENCVSSVVQSWFTGVSWDCLPCRSKHARSAPAALNTVENDFQYICVNILSAPNWESIVFLFYLFFFFKEETEIKWEKRDQPPAGSTGGLTSSSFSFLKQRHAALLLKPSPSYVLVWLGLNFIIYIIECAAGKR